MPDPVGEQLDSTLLALRSVIPQDELLGVYVYGSAVAGGLKPDSDLDLLVVTRRRLTPPEKRSMVDRLMPISGRATRPVAWRPVELTVVTRGDLSPWRYPPLMDLQYGEWLRQEFLAGHVPTVAAPSPDLAILVAMVLDAHRPILGPSPRDLLDPVPEDDLVRAMTDELPALLTELEDDTRNVLLTLTRIWATLATGTIMSKDNAAAWTAERLAADHRRVIERARDLYLNGGFGPWTDQAAVAAPAAAIIGEIRRLSMA